MEAPQEKRNLAAMTGDGVNDAPALKKAGLVLTEENLGAILLGAVLFILAV